MRIPNRPHPRLQKKSDVETGPPSCRGGPLDARRHPLVLVLAAVSLGVVTDHLVGNALPSVTPEWLPGPTAWLLGTGVCWLAWYVLHRPETSTWSLCLLLAGFLGCGGTWHHVHWRWFPANHLGLRLDGSHRPICLDAIVLSGPKIHPAVDDPWGPPREASSQLRVRVVRARDAQRWIEMTGSGHLRVTGIVEGIGGGDTIRLFGYARAPSRPANPGDFDFAYRLRMQRELFLLQARHPDCVVRLRKAAWWSPRRVLESIRQRGRATLARHLPEHHAHLAGALLLGARELLSDDDILPFFLTGTVHLLAISGLHLGILVSGIWVFARVGWISGRCAIILCLLLVLPYALVTECRPPVVRAAVFVLVVCGGRWLWRPVVGWNTLAAAGLFLLALNPLHLFQTGVHLSFLAICGLSAAGILFQTPPKDPLDRLLESTRSAYERALRRGLSGVVRMLLASLAVWLLTLPLVASHFHIVSLAGVVLNPLLWLPLAGALFSGFLLILGGICLPGNWMVVPGRVLGNVCSLCLSAGEWLIESAASWRWSHFWTSAPPTWWIVTFYLAVTFWACFPIRRPSQRGGFAFGLAWLAIGFFLMIGPRLSSPSNRLVCTFFSVGHGTCVLIETPDGEFLLYDAGHLGPPKSVVRTLSQYLWSARRNGFERIVISHADMDHFNAVPGLVERFRVGETWVPPHLPRSRSPLVLRLRDFLQQQSVEVRVVDRDLEAIRSPSGFQIEVLHPSRTMRSGSDNAQSLVLRLSYAGRRILLPGDLESPGLELLLQSPSMMTDVVMAPHHGSARSQPERFVQWSRPRWVIISGGTPVAEPVADAFREGGAELWETSRAGAIRVEVHRDGTLRVRSWRTSPWR